MRQSFGVAPVIRRGAVEDDLSVAPDLFLAQVQAALLLVESHLVGPLDVIGHFERGCYLNIGKAACRQAAEGADSPAPAHGFLQAAAGNGQIAQEPEGIQKVGLARSIGPDEKEPPANLHVAVGKILPVAELQACEPGVPHSLMDGFSHVAPVPCLACSAFRNLPGRFPG